MMERAERGRRGSVDEVEASAREKVGEPT